MSSKDETMIKEREREGKLTLYSPLEFINLVFITSSGWQRNVAQPPWTEKVMIYMA